MEVYLGTKRDGITVSIHENIQHTVKYTATNPARFERLWK
jgi:hypothetical protein